MSHEIICRECNASNPPGSKFCSNCGAKLPPSTRIICPNCGTANPHDRIFCDNCGTKLVGDTTVPLDEEKPEKPAGRGSAYSLPARRPGETGELDPSLLPEWLRTGDTKSHQTAEDADDDDKEEEPQELPEWLQKSVDDTKDLVQPKKLDDLTPDKKGTDDLPDWLVDDSDSNPIIATPEEISTEMYLDLVNQDEDNIDEGTPADLKGAILPDWLSEAGQISDTGKLSSEALPDEIEDPAEQEPETESGVPEWLAAITDDGFDLGSSEGNQASDISGLTELLSMADTPEPESQQESEDDGFTDWLSDAFPLDDEESNAVQGETTGASASEADWLSEAFSEDSTPPSQPKGDPSDARGLTDWLSDPFGSEDQTAEQPDTSDDGGLTDWLADPFDSKTDDATLEPSDSEGLMDWLSPEESDIQPPLEESETVDDWLSELDHISESESGGTGSLEDLTDAPDWLLEEVDTPAPKEPPPLDTSAGIADEIAKTLGGGEHVPTDFADLFQVDSTDAEDLPDWLAGAASSGDSFIAQEENDPAEALDNLFEKEEFAAQSELDWLMQTGGLNLPDEPEETLDVPEELQSDLHQQMHLIGFLIWHH